jgi:hypothetical protein
VAKKARTPTPPRAKRSGTQAPPRRPVQAPKVRTRKDEARRRPSWLLLALAGAGLAALAVVIAVVLLGRSGDDTRLAAGPLGTSCRLSFHPTQPPNQHVSNPNQNVKYSTFPPTSGKHFSQPAKWGFFDAPVPPVQVVHNLEHGGVIIWFGPKVSAQERAQLREFWAESPNSMFGTEYPPLGSRVALTAWVASGAAPTKDGGKVMMCAGVDEGNLAAMRQFRDEYRGKGPERIPTSFNQPGT